MKITVLWFILILSPDFISSEVFIVGPRSISFQQVLQLYVINTVKSNDEFEIILTGKSSGEELYTDEDNLKLNFDQKKIEISSVRS